MHNVGRRGRGRGRGRGGGRGRGDPVEPDGKLENGGRYAIFSNATGLGFDGRTTTEEGVPVTVVHVANLPTGVTRRDLLTAFGNFGRVVGCYVRFDADDRSRPVFAFVTFSSAADALRARRARVEMDSRTLRISPADSWHQERSDRRRPGTPSAPAPPEIFEDAPEPRENLLTILNDDCALKILSYLPLVELIRSERVCKRWKYLVEQRLSRVREFKTREFGTEWNHRVPLGTSILRKLLAKFGRHLRVLHLDQEWTLFGQRTPYLIGKHCSDLVELVAVGVASKEWKSALSKCRRLKSLTFESCEDVTDDALRHCAASLEELVLRDAPRVVGTFLARLNLERLKKFSIVGCGLKAKHLAPCLPRLTGLRELALDELDLSGPIVKDALERLPELRSLSLSFLKVDPADELAAIADLKRLEILRLKMNTGVNDDLVKRICTGCPDLTVLDVSKKMCTDGHRHHRVSDEGFAHVWKLKRLQVLNASALDITDSAFSNVGRDNNGIKLQELIIRHNDNITETTVVNVARSCPELKKMDVFNCLNIGRRTMDKVREVRQAFFPNGRLHVNMSLDSFEDLRSETPSGKNVVITYEGFDAFLLGSYISEDVFSEDEDMYSIDFSFDDVSDDLSDFSVNFD